MAKQGAAGSGKDRDRPAQGRPAAPHGSAPRRSASPQVLRRRRAVVGVIALAVLLGVVAAAAYLMGKVGGAVPVSPVGSQGRAAATTAIASQPTSPPSAASPPSATSTPPLGQATPCSQDKIRVSASVDSQVYVSGKDPVLSLSVTNSGTEPCAVNLGTSQMEFLIKSGGDRIFSSKDCQEGAEDLVKTVAPGTSETAKFPWSRNRTVPGCKHVTAIPKPGNYVYQAKLGQHLSDPIPFKLL